MIKQPSVRFKRTAIVLLIVFTLSAAGVALKLNGFKTIGDIVLLSSTLGFYYFLYKTFFKKKQNNLSR
jgi:hypothetical protein